MMKRTLLLLFMAALSVNLFAKKTFYNAQLFFTDGTTKNGLTAMFELSEDKYVYFKLDKGAREEKIESAQLSKIIFNLSNKESYEFDLLKIYKGWKQERIGGPVWLQLVEKGIATLYVNQTTFYNQYNVASVSFWDYYCIRPGEPAAKWISAVASMNNNAHFKAKAPLYFKDYPELAAKIESKEYTYKDIITVVEEYNRWATKKKK